MTRAQWLRARIVAVPEEDGIFQVAGKVAAVHSGLARDSSVYVVIVTHGGIKQRADVRARKSGGSWDRGSSQTYPEQTVQKVVSAFMLASRWVIVGSTCLSQRHDEMKSHGVA